MGTPVRHDVAGIKSTEIPAPPQQLADFELVLDPELPIVGTQLGRSAKQIPIEAFGNRFRR